MFFSFFLSLSLFFFSFLLTLFYFNVFFFISYDLFISLKQQPTADGEYIIGQPMEEFPRGNYNKVPFMLGTVDQEALIFLYTALPGGLTPKQYREIIEFVFQADAPKVLKMYPVADNVTDARPQFTLLGTDYVCFISALFYIMYFLFLFIY